MHCADEPARKLNALKSWRLGYKPDERSHGPLTDARTRSPNSEILQTMSILIQNGEIVTAGERYVADIFCEGETITRIERDIAVPPGAPGVEVIDASGMYVFPGFIDPHVH